MSTSLHLILMSLFFGIIGSPQAFANDAKECKLYWDRIQAKNAQFEGHQDKEAGTELLAILPTGKKTMPAECEAKAAAIESLNQNRKFRQQLLKDGKPLGFQIAFRMRHIKAGSFEEALDAELANSIESHPHMFLKVLIDDLGDIYCPRELVMALENPLLPYKLVKEVYAKRINALNTVADTDLQGMRFDCVKQLKKPNDEQDL